MQKYQDYQPPLVQIYERKNVIGLTIQEKTLGHCNKASKAQQEQVILSNIWNKK